MIRRILLLLIVSVPFSFAQLHTVTIEEIVVPPTEVWNSPVFSPDGKNLFLTNSSYDGIWHYALESKTLKEITREQHSGYSFDISDDGKYIAYRRTVRAGDHITRVQESVTKNISTGSTDVIERGNSIHTPVFVGTIPVSQKSNLQKISQTAAPVVLGIEDTKISMLINGQQVLLDPLNGQYIWPRLSPDAGRLVAVEMDRGAFVYVFADSKVQQIGKCNSPTWSKDGKWIIGMNDRDDGHTIYASDIIAVTPDGKTAVTLTESFDGIALNPSASPVEYKVVFNTADGKIFVLTFEEVK
jgi:Tol biopolymer transport system component